MVETKLRAHFYPVKIPPSFNAIHGLEFMYRGKNCIFSIAGDILIAYLGEEHRFYDLGAALEAPIFDGRSYRDIRHETDRNL